MRMFYHVFGTDGVCWCVGLDSFGGTLTGNWMCINGLERMIMWRSASLSIFHSVEGRYLFPPYYHRFI